MGNQHIKPAFRSTPPKVVKNDELIRIMMVGKTGVGKSATGNTILGQECFKSEFSPQSVTTDCDKVFGVVDGEQIAVIDTPGLFDTRITEEKTVKDIAQSIAYACPGPHIFLVVIKLGRFTEEEKQTVQMIQKIFGEEADKYSMVLFTYGDRLKGETVEEFLEDNKDLQELVAKCNGQYHVFNNKEKDRSQVRKLLKKIKKINEQNEGSYYTTEMFQNAESVIEEEKQRILKEKEEEIRKDQEKCIKEIEERFEQILKEDCSIFSPTTASNNDESIRIVMVGKTGAGKSAAGNTILGKQRFKSKFDTVSLTLACEKVFGKVDGQKVAVIDTPGLFDTRIPEKKTVKDIAKCIAYASPGPHIFLVIIKLGIFTEEEKQTVHKIQEIFGEEANKYSMVLFTYGDLLKGKSIDEFLNKSEDLKELVAKCNGHYHVFNNEVKDRSQVIELLKKIKKINEQNEGSYYTTEKFQKAEKAIVVEKKRILKEKKEEIQKKQEGTKKEIEDKYLQTLREVNADREREDELKEECEKEIQDRMEQLMEKVEREARKTAEESDLVKKALINVSLIASVEAQPQKITIQADEQHEHEAAQEDHD